MRFVLVTTGSWGDTRPFLALALGLQQAGHEALVAGPTAFAERAAGLGLAYHPLTEGGQGTEQAEAGAGGGWRSGVRRLEAKRRIFEQVNGQVYRCCREAQAIAYRIGGFLAADSVAEKLDIPCFKIGLVPYTPTGEIPSLYLYPKGRSGKLRNRLSHVLGEQLVWQSLRGPTNTFRRQVLGLERQPFLGPGQGRRVRRLPVLYAFSPMLVRRPQDWPENVHITGHWEAAALENWQPSPELAEFVRSGTPPVYAGFGSMRLPEAGRINQLVVDALKACGQRGVLCGELGEAQALPGESGRIFRQKYIPHEWLFPRAACVVHHGGIGTTTMQLKAGTPGVIVPFNFDQPFWGEAAFHLGVAAPPIPIRQLTAGGLAGALSCCLDSREMRARAAEVARQVRAERGVEVCIEIMHRYMAERTKV